MTEEIVHPKDQFATKAKSYLKWCESRRFWVGAMLAAVVVAMLLAVDLFPIITNDSISYLEHSNSIGTTGFVQAGYRQAGYPTFLASVDAIASATRMEPLLLTVLIQRAVYLSALAFAAWLFRWRALPLIGLGVLPTLLVYSNFILTEGLGVGLALWYAVLVAWIIRLGSQKSDGKADSRIERTIIVAGAVVGAIVLALGTIRFHYIFASFGLIAVLYVMYSTSGKGRTAARILAASVFVLGSSFLLFASVENAREFGPFFPSVGGERSQFWAAWQTTFTLIPANQENNGLIDLYADGNPYTVMGKIDALPTYADQQNAYDEAIDQLLDGAGTSITNERIKAIGGALVGGRIDDVNTMVLNASRTTFETVEQSMYRASIARREGIDFFISRYNEGRPIQPVLTSPLAPLRTFPYFVSVYQWFLVASAVVMLAGLSRRPTRLLSTVGLLTLLSTALVFGYLLMDNVRFMLVPLLFVAAIATGVTDIGWRHLRTPREHDRVQTTGATPDL